MGKNLEQLEKLHKKVNKRRPWANEGIFSGTARLAKDGLYASTQIAVPRIGAQNMRLKKAKLHMMTLSGSLMFNMFVAKTKELVDGFDASRTSIYDLGAFALHAGSRFSDQNYDNEREYDVEEYFALRERMRSEGTLPPKWENSFESIQEEGLTKTDFMVGYLVQLYLTYQNTFGGPVSYDRMKHWYNTELNYEGLGTQREIGFAYRARNGEKHADLSEEFRNSNHQDTKSKYLEGNNNDAGEEFHPVALAEEAAIIAAGGV